MIALDAGRGNGWADGRRAGATIRHHPSTDGRSLREEVGRLREALCEIRRREEAAEIIRGLIECIVLNPEAVAAGKRTLTIDLKGHLAGILSLTAATKKTKGANGVLISNSK